jgi:hypothetical protein
MFKHSASYGMLALSGAIEGSNIQLAANAFTFDYATNLHNGAGNTDLK